MAFIELNDVEKHYDQGEHQIRVLNGVNFALDQGQTLAIIGQSGSGKSSLLALLAGLDHIDSGRIVIAGKDLTKLGQKALCAFRRMHLGIVFQQFHLLKHLKASENVSLPLEILGSKDYKAKSLRALDEVGLAHRANHYPHQLSGGEQQRVAIARAFVTHPPLILADEPSGNLDMNTGEKVMNLLFRLVSEHQMTMILVTHNQKLASQCARTVKLGNGVIVEE